MGKKKVGLQSLIEVAIKAKGQVATSTAEHFRDDAVKILESLVAELEEGVVLKALKRQGFFADAFLPTLRTLSEVAKARRPERAGGNEKEQ